MDKLIDKLNERAEENFSYTTEALYWGESKYHIYKLYRDEKLVCSGDIWEVRFFAEGILYALENKL